MEKKSFNRGMSKLMTRGHSKQSAFNIMKGLATKNRGNNLHRAIKSPPQARYSSVIIRYLLAIIIELILLAYKVPSKEDVQILLIKTIIPFSEATKPLEWPVTIIAVIMQIASLLLIYELWIKLFNFIRKSFS